MSSDVFGGRVGQGFGHGLCFVTIEVAFGEQPLVALLDTSSFGSAGGGKESVYRLYLVITIQYFVIIQANPFFRSVNSRRPTEVISEARKKVSGDRYLVLSPARHFGGFPSS